MKKLITSIVAAIFITATSFAGTATDIQGLYYTGVDDNGVTLASGSIDSHWVITYSNVPGHTGDTRVVSSSFIDPAWVQNTSTAQWIVAPGASTSASGGTLDAGGVYLPGNGTSGKYDAYYVYTLTFTIIGVGKVDSLISNNIDISLTIAADDSYQVFVNPILRKNGDINTGPSNAASAIIDSAWDNTSIVNLSNYGANANSKFYLGENTLSVIVRNTNSITGGAQSDPWNPSGFMLYNQYGDIRIDGNIVPEPSTYGACFVGLVLAIVIVKRRKNKISPADVN